MKVFITGASGYIGSALTKELLQHGHTVLGLARSDASAEKIKALGAEVHRGNTDDLASIQAGAAAADAVVHCAFDHNFTDFASAEKKDNATITALGAALAGTNKPLITSSGLLTIRAREYGLLTENCRGDTQGVGAGRERSEEITLGLAQKGVRASVVRFAPTVHGGPDKPTVSWIGLMVDAARKHGFSAYIADGAARWPAANVLDAAVLLRLILEGGPGGLIYHAVADEANSLRDIATAIGAHLSLPVKSVAPGEEALVHFGFLSHIMNSDIPTSSALTRERTGWRPSHHGLLAELQAGNPLYY
jgi:nucleoside-diphosphate-sugar epimerase